MIIPDMSQSLSSAMGAKMDLKELGIGVLWLRRGYRMSMCLSSLSPTRGAAKKLTVSAKDQLRQGRIGSKK